MLGASMPVAAVYEDCHLHWAENQVRSTTKVRQRTRAHPVTQPLRMHQAPDQLLGFGVAIANRLHIATASGG